MPSEVRGNGVKKTIDKSPKAKVSSNMGSDAKTPKSSKATSKESKAKSVPVPKVLASKAPPARKGADSEQFPPTPEPKVFGPP